MIKPDDTYTTYIAASPDKVWDALTNGKITPQYFFGRRIESEWKTGGRWALIMADGRVDSEGIVTECIRNVRLSLTWRVVWVPEMKDFPEGYVTYFLEEAGPGVTRLRMEQSHASPVAEQWLEMGRKGWAVILSGLKTLLETGKPLPPVQM
jgi:uncharacterized protein YndB with AHSA1/START domain